MGEKQKKEIKSALHQQPQTSHLYGVVFFLYLMRYIEGTWDQGMSQSQGGSLTQPAFGFSYAPAVSIDQEQFHWLLYGTSA